MSTTIVTELTDEELHRLFIGEPIARVVRHTATCVQLFYEHGEILELAGSPEEMDDYLKAKKK